MLKKTYPSKHDLQSTSLFSNNKDLRGYKVEFSEILRRYQNTVPEWKLTDTQNAQLGNYLQAIRLLVDCLEVATVRDREGILAKVLTVDE